MPQRIQYAWARRRRARASFRGVAFEELVRDEAGGRRIHVHSYPGIDEPWAEDLGRLAHGFRLDAIVVGPNYDRELDRLKAALDKYGAGRLERTAGPAVSVVCRRWRVVERAHALGMALLSIEFVESGRRLYPVAGPGGKSQLDRALARIKAAAIARFPAIAGNLASVTSLASAMRELGQDFATTLSDTLAEIDHNVGAAQDAASAINAFTTDLARLASSPAEFASGVSDLIDEVVAIPSDTARKFAALMSLTGWGANLESVPDQSSYTGGLAYDNQAAAGSLVSRLALAHAARMAADLEFESAQDAASVRDELVAVLDVEMLAAADSGDDEVFAELRGAKAAAVADLDARAARLPLRVAMTLDATVPSVVLAHRLYGSSERAIELAARNKVRHPGFMPAATALEVLSVVDSAG